ncbi:MAG: rhomboid family intramembrane serine protease [Candidatus Pacearchaeota archaeon]
MQRANLYARKRSAFSAMPITWQLILLNLFCFFVSFILWLAYPASIGLSALVPANIIAGKYFWTLVTHMFLHSGFFHLFFNMFTLFYLGSFCERIIGRKRFIRFYLISGVLAGLLAALTAGLFGFGLGERIFGAPETVMLGASGAIFGIAGILSIITPRKKVYLIAGPLLAIVLQSILEFFFDSSTIFALLNVLIMIYIFISIFSMFSPDERRRKIALPVAMPFWIVPLIAIVPLVVIGLFVPLPIGNVAHFGGLIAGLAYGTYLRMKYANKIRIIERHFSN